MKVLLLLSFFSLGHAKEIQFSNELPTDVWVGSQGKPGHEHLNGGGWVLLPGENMFVSVAEDWSGSFWGRTGCNSITQHCLIGDCGDRLQCNGAGATSPVSAVEITVNGDAGSHFYDISLVDGYNVPTSVEPLGGTEDAGQFSCKKIACNNSILSDCPLEFQIRDGENIFGCKSHCIAYDADGANSFAYQTANFTCDSSQYKITFGP